MTEGKEIAPEMPTQRFCVEIFSCDDDSNPLYTEYRGHIGDKCQAELVEEIRQETEELVEENSDLFLSFALRNKASIALDKVEIRITPL